MSDLRASDARHHRQHRQPARRQAAIERHQPAPVRVEEQTENPELADSASSTHRPDRRRSVSRIRLRTGAPSRAATVAVRAAFRCRPGGPSASARAASSSSVSASRRSIGHSGVVVWIHQAINSSGRWLYDSRSPMAGNMRASASALSSVQKHCANRWVWRVTGSVKSPPGGEIAEISVTEPSAPPSVRTAAGALVVARPAGWPDTAGTLLQPASRRAVPRCRAAPRPTATCCRPAGRRGNPCRGSTRRS